MSSLTVFYHAYCGGAWQEPVSEFLDALGGYDGKINLGLVGSPENCREVADLISLNHEVEVVAEKERGWEQVTLVPLSRWVRRHGGLVLYAHTKGAANPSEHAMLWRQSMTDLIVRDRDYCRSQIWTRGYDVVCTHWLVPEDWRGLVTTPMAGGNFWIATARYLRTLPPVRTRTRHEAEEWVGYGRPRPRVLDRKPGWPFEFAFRDTAGESQMRQISDRLRVAP